MPKILMDMLYILITGCGMALVRYIIVLANKKVDEVQVNTDIKNHDKLNQYVDSAQQVIENVVLAVSQTYVDTLKANGEFTKEAQNTAKATAIKLAKQMITDESKNAIIVLYEDFDQFLDTTIEALVKTNKY